jgi:hypothetical protein
MADDNNAYLSERALRTIAGAFVGAFGGIFLSFVIGTEFTAYVPVGAVVIISSLSGAFLGNQYNQ